MNNLFIYQILQSLSQNTLGLAGSLSDLTTTNQDSIIDAINENVTNVGTAQSDATQALADAADNLAEINAMQSASGGIFDTDGTWDNTNLTGTIAGAATSLANAINLVDAAVEDAAGVDTIEELDDTAIAAVSSSHILVYHTDGDWHNRNVAGEATMSELGVFTLENSAIIGKVLTGIALTTNGTVAATDTVLEGIGYINANQLDLTTLSGMSQGAVDLGTFTGDTINDNVTIKAALQALETEVESAAASNDSINSLTDTNLSAALPAADSYLFFDKSANGGNGEWVDETTISADFLVDGATNAAVTLTQESNWDTAYGWGDHASGGYAASADVLLKDGSVALTANWDSGASGIKSSKTPTADEDLTNKLYVDAVATGLGIKSPVVFMTDADLTCNYNNGTSGLGATLTSTTNIVMPDQDGVTPEVADRLIVNGQTNKEENGIYVVTSVGVAGTSPFVLTRATDYDNNPTGEIVQGSFAFIKEGTDYATTGWVQNLFTVNDTIGTDDIEFVQFSESSDYSAGTGLDLAGTVFSVDFGTSGSKAISATVLASTTNGEGASLLGIEDSGALITATDVENALAENRGLIDTNTTHISSDGSDHTFLDQSVISGASPTFDGANFTGVDAANVDVADSSAYFDGSNVEAVLSEMYSELKNVDQRYIDYTFNASNQLTQEDHYASNGGNRLAEISYSYNGSNNIDTIVNKIYAGDGTPGTLISTATDTYTYDGGNPDTITRAIT